MRPFLLRTRFFEMLLEELESFRSSSLRNFNPAIILCRSLSSLIRRVSALVMADIKKIRFSLLSIGLSFHIDYANEF